MSQINAPQTSSKHSLAGNSKYSDCNTDFCNIKAHANAHERIRFSLSQPM